MDKKYETPIITVITFEKEDIIRTSGFGDTGKTANDEWPIGKGDPFWN